MDEAGNIVRLRLSFDPEAVKRLAPADIHRLMERIKREVTFDMPEKTVPYAQKLFRVKINDVLAQP